ncbi:MAG: 23S rRNA (pseudouridine(1915)-N(3))-methyltransferase RlmH [Sphingobacteriales bacterium]|jgi:23S rRNA (pseudouridine1915-N3)-methyltransferase|nr:MAG: 23S rRNA (pseudouridine(1915)-N(3))-methyltransferase RlmH [Sphingobacteriales bacterium]
MKITLLSISKTEEKYIKEGIDIYLNRLKHYIKFEVIELPELKNTKHLSQDLQKKKEAEILLKSILNTDYVVLLDERGTEFNSLLFADFLNKRMLASTQNLVFIIGGPYGFDTSIYERATAKISLSKLTFSHQMVRLFFVEQVYRGFTILKGEPYHHA